MVTRVPRPCVPPAFALTLLLLCLPRSGHAGITGTLSGTVTDAQTGQPLPGANITLKGTTRGAACDAAGNYIISFLPPGSYTVTAQMIGYARLTQTGVYVRAEARTFLDFALTVQTLAFGKEVVITAERDLLRMEVTGSQYEVQGESIKALPVATPEEVVNLQPGVVEGHIRGGRTTEVLYLVDGIPAQEALAGGRGIAVPNIAIQDMTIQTGGFNAEYGNAMSGIVNIITREGFDKSGYYLEGTTDVAGALPGSWDETHFDRQHNLEGALGGALGSRLRYFLSAQYRTSDTRWRRAFRQFFPGPMEQGLQAQGKITLAFNPTQRLVLQGILSLQDYRVYEHRWVHNLKGLPPRSRDSARWSAGWTHTLNARTFYTAKLSTFSILKSVQGRTQRQYDLNLQFDDAGHFVLAGDKAWWQDSEENIINARVDLIHQVHLAHQIKAGADFSYYDLYMNNVQIEPFPPNFHPELPPEFRFNVYNTKFRYFPKAGAFYLQDKLELKRFSLNFGVRYEVLDPAGERPVIEDLQKTNSNEIQVFTRKVPVSIKSQWSPRFGVAFPLGAQDKLHLNYGHFFQAPLFEYLFTNLEYDFTAYNPLLGNPDLAPEKTVALEVGYERVIGQELTFSITAFNKDITNLVDVQFYPIPLEDTGLQSSGVYTRFVNLAYGTAQGLELFVRKQQGKKLRGQMSYTLMTARGSSFAMGDKTNILQFGGRVEQREHYLSWDQRHTFIIHLDYRPALESHLNVVWRINSPKPYTLAEDQGTTAGAVIVPNNRRLGWTNSLDLKASIRLPFRPGRLALQAEIRNLLDSRNLLWRDQQGRVGGILDDPTAYDAGRRVSLGLVWHHPVELADRP